MLRSLCCDRSKWFKLWYGDLLRHRLGLSVIRPVKCYVRTTRDIVYVRIVPRAFTPFGKALFANLPYRREPVRAWSRTNNTHILYLCHQARDCYTTFTNAGRNSREVIASTSHSRNVASLMDLFLRSTVTTTNLAEAAFAIVLLIRRPFPAKSRRNIDFWTRCVVHTESMYFDTVII